MCSKIINVEAKCPHCRESIMDEKVQLNTHPSIRVIIEAKEGKGPIYLCATYGCYDHKTDVPIVQEEIVDIYCEMCDKLLNTKEFCDKCDAPMVSFALKWGGSVNICSRIGCKKHNLEFENVADALRSFHHNFGIDL